MTTTTKERMRTRELYEELEAKYQKKTGIDAKNKPRKQYRHTLQILYQALLRCENPTKIYHILDHTSTNRTRHIIENLIITGIIEGTGETKTWVITEKGRQLRADIKALIDKYPFLLMETDELKRLNGML